MGEQVTLKITTEKVNEAQQFISAWPQLNDTINHTEILKRTAIDSINVNGIFTYQQSFTLTSFDSGRWQLGPFNFTIQEKATGKKTPLASTPLYLTVLTVDVSSLEDYHPIKDIIDVEVSYNWKPVIIAALIILILIILFIILKNRKKKVIAKPKIILKGTPLERALEKLQALQNERLTSNEKIKNFHLEIDDIVRLYFEELTHVKTFQLTATELFSRLNVYMKDAQLRTKFQQVFEMNSSVKFAKYMPHENESKSTLQEIISALEQIDATVNMGRNNADRVVSKY